MAKDKKSFLLYADIIYTIEHLTNEEKGRLFKHLLEYVNDLNPVLEDRILLIAWKPIERQLKRDLKKYESKKEERSRSGQLGNLKKYNADLYERVKSDEITLKQALAIAETRKASHSDTKLAVNDTDTVNDTVIHLYSEQDFLKNWNEARKWKTKQPSNLNVLKTNEKDLFWNASQLYTKEQFKEAIMGLFTQERIPVEIMWFRPKHFLENIDTYLDAKQHNNITLYKNV